MFAIEKIMRIENKPDWIILKDGEAMVTEKSLELIEEALEKCESDTNCWFHCIPMFPMFTSTSVLLTSSLYALRNRVTFQASCQLAIRKSFLESNLADVKQWFENDKSVDLEESDLSELSKDVIESLKKYKDHFSCFEALGNKVKYEDQMEAVRLSNRCGFMARLPLSGEFVSSQGYNKNEKEVLTKIAERRKEAMQTVQQKIETFIE